jgi:hypothetical protein
MASEAKMAHTCKSTYCDERYAQDHEKERAGGGYFLRIFPAIQPARSRHVFPHPMINRPMKLKESGISVWTICRLPLPGRRPIACVMPPFPT